ncbi:hypothetical protein [Chryseobacterium sp. MP_3.2]|uniref:hypothetical protein n=1 Tax=Chryseobacterium sp. MP_3.2 TaxID=3071712 RepID=UPI002DFE6DEB|nr:Zn ribbon nucleic-acid-binding protein [Chryseobacterium sp. MP_3.2]
MTGLHRFQDENLTIADFFKEVLVVCPTCQKKALATVNFEEKLAYLICLQCGLNKKMTTQISNNATINLSADQYFDAQLWLQAPFKSDNFWSYNESHLHYLELYISATLREHKDRTHFTLIEKLPKFYHDAKNRTALLKIISKLKSKV